ncbi:MAG: hypothetical protein LAO30_07250 [Acidobacteriia bacterium]|nr:hypothetical protein [Terriglobia bacterium]
MEKTPHVLFGLCQCLIVFSLLLCVLAGRANAAELHLPTSVEAGQAFSIPLAGSGPATFYLMGPDHVVKRTVNLDNDLQIQSSDVRAAGLYQVILCDASCTSATFEVKATQPAHLSFFLHPSRVPVSTPDSIDATAFAFDPYFNLVLTPTAVDFRITPASGAGFSQQGSTRHGVAWMRMGSTPHEGPVQVTAILSSAGNVLERRVIQQVAAEACGLRMKAVANGNAVTLETDPVRDCSGNALPDGTVVSFTKIDKAGKSTVDTPLKKGVARTRFRIEGSAQISVACGVVLGNEVALNGRL